MYDAVLGFELAITGRGKPHVLVFEPTEERLMKKLPEKLVEELQEVQSVGAITGAGVSQESGIRTYRGKGGIYDDPLQGERTVAALSGITLATNPDRTWVALASMAQQARSARPNPGHLALVTMEKKAKHFVLLTQNVDGLHQEAGSRNVIDIHGNISATVCLSCGVQGELERSQLQALKKAPRCPECEGVLRPDVVLFGELLPPNKVQRMQHEFQRQVPDLVLIAGTSAYFPYITEPVVMARQLGKLTVEVNPEPTLLSEVVQYSLRGPSGSWLPLIAEAL